MTRRPPVAIRRFWMVPVAAPHLACSLGLPDDTPLSPGGPPTDVLIRSSAENSSYMQIGDTLRLTTVVTDASGFEMESSDTAVRTWTLSGPSLASLDPQAPSAREVLVTGLSPGPVTVTATALGLQGTLDLRVLPRLASVAIEPDAAELAVGDSIFVAARIIDTDGHEVTGLFPEWRFGDANLAAFRDIGVPAGLRLYGVAPGTYILGVRIAHVTGASATIQIVTAASH